MEMEMDLFSSNAELQVIDIANEVINKTNREELAKYFSPKEDCYSAKKLNKEMESTRDQLAEALYYKGLALAEIEELLKDKKFAKERLALAEMDECIKGSRDFCNLKDKDLFEENFKELKKWVDVTSPKYCALFEIHEKRSEKLGREVAQPCLVYLMKRDSKKNDLLIVSDSDHPNDSNTSWD